MEKFNRSERLIKLKQLKEKRKHYLGYNRSHDGYQEKMNDILKGKIANTSRLCSCFLCSSRRKHLGDTLKEIINKIDLKDF